MATVARVGGAETTRAFTIVMPACLLGRLLIVPLSVEPVVGLLDWSVPTIPSSIRVLEPVTLWESIFKIAAAAIDSKHSWLLMIAR